MSNSIPSSSNPIPSSSNPKKNKGRRRIEMKMIAKDSNLQVTFSKHRTGLFKKASELCTLCDAKFGLVVFSLAKKAFSFGKPSIDVVVDRYQMRDQPLNLGNMQYLEAHRNANVQELNDKINRINEDLEIEKMCSEELAKQRKEEQEHFWWAAPIEEINGERCDQFMLALENLKKNVLGVVERQNNDEGVATAAAPIPPPPQFFTGGASSSNNALPPPPQPPTLEFQVQPPPPPQQFPVNPQPPP
ncbi:PREDICTED: agamous-like MADS-box protein AGL62 [Lupinus angustifolius]|uniref:agamous-like MADS-box protein AGL62 n=1 Tax=Lupinus angustifolius TaxID=3871 RepID=UPI00092ED979|nr:PREDICTED: agamous-like MADS-box protein AGL62 [Lupinus angustifolius]